MAKGNKTHKSRIGLIILLILIIAAVALVVLNPFKNLAQMLPGQSAETIAEEAMSEVPVRVGFVEKDNLQNYIKLNGDVVDSKTVEVLPEVTGKVTSVQVAVGDRVTESQLLATVDPSRPGMVYRESAVTAPVEGTVLAVNFSSGALVSPQAPLFRIGMLGKLEVETAISERYVGKVAIGSTAELSFAAYPGEVFPGTVVSLAPLLNPATRTLKVNIGFDDPEQKVKAGMFPSIRLHTESIENALLINREALLYEGSQAYVFVIGDGNTVHRKDVTIGLTVDNTAQVLEGLSAGDAIIIQGQTLLNEGTVVRVID